MKIYKLEKIINRQQHLYYNIPYGDEDDYRNGYDSGYSRGKIDAIKDYWDIPIQTELGENFPFTGFVEIDGTIHKCNSCEHEDLVRSIVYDNPEYFKRYRNVPAIFYDRKPQGMLQEEYFLMKYLGFIKISSFEKAPIKKILFRYENLTWKQSDIIYPI